MGNLKGRVERLEGGRQRRGILVIIVHPGETKEEVLQKHLAQHPEDEDEPKLIINLSAAGQDSPAPPHHQGRNRNIARPGPGARSPQDN